MSMVKLIHSSSWDPTVGVGAELIKRAGELSKQASTIFGKEYDELKPDDRSVGIHVVALGDSEHYLANRNGDGFPKEACIKYHDTFVKHGHVFRHHRNKDPEKSIGIVKASAYNPEMGRIELFIHADKEKAAPELERLEKEGEIPFSMACVINADRCSICNNMRKQAGGPDECEHVRDHLGDMFDDGKRVCTFNDTPKFFDISFVGRPADRIAWNLKVASALDLDSVKYAEFEGVTAPDELAVESDSAIRKLGYARDIVSLQSEFRGWLTKSASVVTARDGFLYEFRKIAADSLPDETISRLREEPVRNAMSDLAWAGIVMDVPTFFKYATGDDYEKVVKPYMGQVEKAVPNVLSALVKSSSASKLCNDTTYDAFPDLEHVYTMRKTAELISQSARSIPERIILATIDPKNVEYNLDNATETRVNDGVVEKLAEAYLSYELSAIDAVVNGRRGKKLELEALASVNNLQKK